MNAHASGNDRSPSQARPTWLGRCTRLHADQSGSISIASVFAVLLLAFLHLLLSVLSHRLPLSGIRTLGARLLPFLALLTALVQLLLLLLLLFLALLATLVQILAAGLFRPDAFLSLAPLLQLLLSQFPLLLLLGLMAVLEPPSLSLLFALPLVTWLAAGLLTLKKCRA